MFIHDSGTDSEWSSDATGNCNWSMIVCNLNHEMNEWVNDLLWSVYSWVPLLSYPFHYQGYAEISLD